MYAGPLMSRCARIVSVTPIGHILTTSTVWQIAREACSTGRLCDDAKGDMSPPDDGVIWYADHGWHTFKGIKQPLEIVQIKDKVLSQRLFPETLPRLQRLSSHTADALRHNEMKYAMMRSVSSGRDTESVYDNGSMYSNESLVKSLEEEIHSLKEENQYLQDHISSLEQKAMSFEENIIDTDEV